MMVYFIHRPVDLLSEDGIMTEEHGHLSAPPDSLLSYFGPQVPLAAIAGLVGDEAEGFIVSYIGHWIYVWSNIVCNKPLSFNIKLNRLSLKQHKRVTKVIKGDASNFYHDICLVLYSILFHIAIQKI